MGKFKPSTPKATGPTAEQLAAQKESERRAKEAETNANKELSSSARFATNRRTGRRLLLAPGREDEIAQLGGGSGATGGNF
jgi:hypothetical protein